MSNRSLLISISLCMLLSTVSGAAFAQSSDPPTRPSRTGDSEQFYKAPSTMHGKTVVLPIGTTFEGRIDSTISSNRSRQGQRFNIVLASPVMLNGTDVVIPAGSSVICEVADAVPASNVPKKSYENKKFIKGKLRVQISALRLPDGVTYPMVAHLAGEVAAADELDRNPRPLGTSIAYTGSAGSFEAVNPNRQGGDDRRRRSRAAQSGRPYVLQKGDIYSDPVMGAGEEGFNHDKRTIRSLVLNKRDYYIYSGSPLMVRLSAPFKIGVSAPGIGVPLGAVTDGPQEDSLPPPSRAASARRASGYDDSGRGGQIEAPSRSVVPADSF